MVDRFASWLRGDHRSDPPGPPRTPLIGQLPSFLRDKPGFLARCHGRYGDTVRLLIGGPTLLVACPDDIRHVLVAAADRYGKSPRVVGGSARRVLGLNLFTAQADDHARLRRGTIRCFRPGTVAEVMPLIGRQCERFAATATDRAIVDSRQHLAPWVAECVVAALLGSEVVARDSRWPDALEHRRHQVERLFGLLPVSQTSSPRRGVARDRSVSALVAAAAEQRSDPRALLREFLADDEATAIDQWRMQVESLLLAAYETTLMMLAWTLDLLARHPEWQTSCREPTVAERFLSESLRLYPPTWLIVRVAQRDDRLPSGWNVPAGCKIYLSPFVSQRSPRVFEHPEEFDPDRFLPARVPPPYSYYPFGAGGRSCLGEGLARGIGVSFVTALMRCGRVAPMAPLPPRPIGGLTLRPARAIRTRVMPPPR